MEVEVARLPRQGAEEEGWVAEWEALGATAAGTRAVAAAVEAEAMKEEAQETWSR